MAPIPNGLGGAAGYFSNPDLYYTPPQPPANPVKQKPPYIYTSDTYPNKNVSNRMGQTSISTRLGSIGNYGN